MSEFSHEDFAFAMSHTRVLREPIRRIDTFGATVFEFQILAEPMDGAPPVTVYSGRIEAQKPRIITAAELNELSLEGFGEQADQFREYLESRGELPQALQYGWNIRRSQLNAVEVHEPLVEVEEKLLAEADQKDNPLLAILVGVEEMWEASLVRFAMDLVSSSNATNVFDLKRKGLL